MRIAARLALALITLALLAWVACVAPQTEGPAITPTEDARELEREPHTAPVADAGTGLGDEPDAITERTLRPDDAPCSRGDECASGICEGQGCGVDEGRCMPKLRFCTKDLVPYCGCDGETFRSSGSCPGRTFAFRGACDAKE